MAMGRIGRVICQKIGGGLRVGKWGRVKGGEKGDSYGCRKERKSYGWEKEEGYGWEKGNG